MYRAAFFVFIANDVKSHVFVHLVPYISTIEGGWLQTERIRVCASFLEAVGKSRPKRK